MQAFHAEIARLQQQVFDEQVGPLLVACLSPADWILIAERNAQTGKPEEECDRLEHERHQGAQGQQYAAAATADVTSTGVPTSLLPAALTLTYHDSLIAPLVLTPPLFRTHSANHLTP